MAPIVSRFSKKDYELIGDYAKLKGWRYGLADSAMRIAYFYDKNEKRISKPLSEIEAELNPKGNPKDGKHTRRR
ncbi:hypothetical protein SAMN04487914_108118 [Arthrobacter sp. ok909]|uniref:hypothetical protein n=1 Tax=Arthrobacter sp. ok909 TaxID=1761746 RepID=UPI000888F85B|nr:hypothetical protein [Arthrobacter sp. ok909]SDP33772.1 hypothetical protein SAMN04487914_108118 [Arthrobacter sp. ok909]